MRAARHAHIFPAAKAGGGRLGVRAWGPAQEKPVREGRATAIGMVSYNVQALRGADRLERILKEFWHKRKAEFVGLQGTMWRHKGRDVFSTKASGYMVLHWPCKLSKEAAHTNHSAGVSLAMETKKYPVERIREVFTPPEKLQGRGGAVRLQKRGDGAYDLLVGVLYWATDTGKQQELNANKALTRWAAEVTESVPTRTLVFCLMDANAKLG